MGGTTGALKPRTASVVIYQGDDIEHLANLRRAAEIARRQAEAEAKGPRRAGDDLPGSGALQATQDAYDAAVDEAADRAVVIEVTAVKRGRFRELMATHPAREKNEDDESYGVNMDEFPEPFLRDSVTKIEVGEKSLNPGEIRDLVDGLSEGDFERLFATAYWLNRAPGADPREGRYSSAPLSSAATSN